MKGLKETLAELARLRKRFEGLVSSAAKRGGSVPVAAAPLSEVTGFGRNPGNLRMLVHVPRNLRKAPALVVALHGCTQTAAAYDYGSGWSSLADALGFAVLFPEQQRANNPNNCFNWFLPSDSRRGHGETESIREMIERMIENHGIDRTRVFIVGLSAGGAMAAAMLANYPEIFAGGAIIAGLPYGAATNVQTAFEAMARGRERSGQQWGGLVRSASSHQGRWPKISIWHGTADAIVSPANLEQSVSQWRNVHGVDARPQSEQMLEGHSRRVWRKAGRDVIEAITVDGMAHGVPLATSGPMRSGHAGAFHFDVGISSSHRILEFWQLADRSQAFADKVNAPAREQSQVPISAPAIEPPLIAARETGPGVKSGHSDDSRVGNERRAEAASFPDPREVITAALVSAGLLKSEAPEGRGTSRSLDPTGIVASTLRSVGLLKE